MAFVLGAGALARLVLAIDTPDSHLEALTETYQERAEPEIAAGIRWFYCAGYGIALACMNIISMSHVHKEMEGLRLKKRWRLCGRFLVAIVLICLPLAESLDSLKLVGTVTGLVVAALILEIWGFSCCNDTWCSRSRPCKYTGHCLKKELQAMIRHGKEVDPATLNDPSKNSGLISAAPC